MKPADYDHEQSCDLSLLQPKVPELTSHVVKVSVSLLPSAKQANLFRQYAGSSRFAYNWGLAALKQQLDEKADNPWSVGQLKKEFNRVKHLEDGLAWTLDLPYKPFEKGFQDLAAAVNMFFKNPKTKFPRFKTRSKSKPSFYLNQGSTCLIDNRHIRFAGNTVRTAESCRRVHRLIEKGYKLSPIITVVFDKGRWKVTFTLSGTRRVALRTSNLVVADDVGISKGHTFSTGETVTNPRFYVRGQRKIGRLSRCLSRCKDGSNNRSKAKARLAAAHSKIANKRRQHQYDIVNAIMSSPCSHVVVETLNVSGMLKNHNLAKHIADQAWSEYFNKLSYKCKDNGVVLLSAPRFFPSTQTCSKCNQRNPISLTLSDRMFVCSHCGHIQDRDVNAANNLAQLAHTADSNISTFRGRLFTDSLNDSLRSVRPKLPVTGSEGIFVDGVTWLEPMVLLDQGGEMTPQSSLKISLS